MKEKPSAGIKKKFVTTSGIEMKRVYTPEGIKDIDCARDIGLPGEYPFTRGPYPEMYRMYPWMIRQLLGFEGGSESAQRQRDLLAVGGQVGYNGQPVASLICHTAGHWGFDSDNPMVKYQTGVTGTALDSIEDFKQLIADFPVDRGFYNLAFQGVASQVLFAMYIAAAEELGFSRSKLRGSAGADPVGSRLGFRVQVFPIEAEFKLSGDVLEYCIQNMPRWSAISVGGFNMRGGGIDAITELSLSLAAGIAYVESGMERGLDADQCAAAITYFMSSGIDFLEEVAKLRAARRIWARNLHEKYGVKNPKSMLFRVYSQTLTGDYTAQQAQINIIRGTIQALAAALGGCQAMFVTPYDEAYALPTLDAVTMAIRTQQILIEESGVVNTVDPLGGSYAIEYLTNEIERRVGEYLDKVRAMGKNGSMKAGIIAGIKSGYFSNEITKNSIEREKAINSGEKIIVGRNRYTVTEDVPPPGFKIDPQYQQKRAAELKRLRETRDKGKVEETLKELREVAKSGNNVIPPLIETAKARVTLEEATNVLRDVFGVSELWVGRGLKGC